MGDAECLPRVEVTQMLVLLVLAVPFKVGSSRVWIQDFGGRQGF